MVDLVRYNTDTISDECFYTSSNTFTISTVYKDRLIKIHPPLHELDIMNSA